jgi:hypothetical protein
MQQQYAAVYKSTCFVFLQVQQLAQLQQPLAKQRTAHVAGSSKLAVKDVAQYSGPQQQQQLLAARLMQLAEMQADVSAAGGLQVKPQLLHGKICVLCSCMIHRWHALAVCTLLASIVCKIPHPINFQLNFVLHFLLAADDHSHTTLCFLPYCCCS